jgi:small-conductance mechanosensitive channel
MKNKNPKIRRPGFWEKHWDQQVWVIIAVLLALLITAWGVWASTYGTTSAGRDAEIRALIYSTHAWEVANDKLDRLKEIILANPGSVTDTENALIKAENELGAARKSFEAAGFTALNGEMMIILGVILQIIVALTLVKGIEIFFDRRRRLSKNRVEVERERAGWIGKIRDGQALKDEDEILSLIESEGNISTLRRGQQLSYAYRRLMIKCRKATVTKIPWQQISGLFYKLARICKERKENGPNSKQWQGWESELMVQYKNLNRIIQQDTGDAAYSSILIPVLFIVVFAILSAAFNFLVGETFGEQLNFWRDPILWVALAFFANGVVRVWGGQFTRWLTEKTWTDLDDVIIGAIIGPFSALVTAMYLLVALNILTGHTTPPFESGPFLTWITYEATSNILRTLVIIFVGTSAIVLIVNRFVTSILINWASANRQMEDEVAVKMAQVIVTSSVVAIGIVITLTVIQDPIRKALGTDLTTLLSIFVAIIVAIVGFASRFIFENLLSVISLKIEKPFDLGDRIELPDGRLCEVVSVGLRRTLLRNVDDLSEIAIPNSELAKWSITNISRIGFSRINIRASIADPAQVKLTQALLLDIAYLEREIDQMRVFGAELTTREREKMKGNLILSGNRITIEDCMERLVRRHERIRNTIVSQIIGGGVSEPELVFDMFGDKDPWRKVLTNIEIARRDYQKILQEETAWVLQGIVKSKDDKAYDRLRNYRRAINEVVFSGFPSPDELDNAISEVALRERIDDKNLREVLLLLADKTVNASVNQDVLNKIRKTLNRFENTRLSIVLNISDEVAILKNYIYAIKEQYSDLRPELDDIIGELAKEPFVSSEYLDDGRIRLTLNCYTLYLERRLEIQHNVNRDIGQRFKNAGIKFA